MKRTNRESSERLFQRHQELLGLYSASRRSHSVGSNASSIVPHTDQHVSQHDLKILKKNFRFIRDDEVDAELGEKDWQIRMSVRYYQQLFREYALADLSRYQEGKIGLRWRTEMEVVTGKGQFSCGNKECDERLELRSYELLFAYHEQRERKRCLVKVRACTLCAEKLFYRKLLEMKQKSLDGKKKQKRRRLETKEETKQQMISSHSEDQANDIHALCAEINADQKMTYLKSGKVMKSHEHEKGFAELLL
ncbi:putative folate-sensitive fragile site protein Fra10Ac1 [Plasmopara halstedii]